MSALTGSSVRGSVNGQDLLAVALGALREMTLDEREAFLDYYVTGSTDREIARRLGLSQSWIHQLKHRARDRVYAHLEPNLAVAA